MTILSPLCVDNIRCVHPEEQVIKAKRYALVGCGGRGISMFGEPIQNYLKTSKLVGICDLNPGRMEYLKKKIQSDVPAFTGFDQMLRETNPDMVIVATKDSTHHEFIIRALEYGCDVISEKPMTIDEHKCQQVLDAEKRTGQKIIVTFNLRFVPYVAKIKELLSRKAIGRVISIDFDYNLDRSHGADYFRRWHRRKENSGGLMVHKSTHHFDLVNWFLEQEPVEVSAMGSRIYYGATRKERGENCRKCDFKKTCEHYFDIHQKHDELYAKVEHHDGYIRDQCVFSDEIDIEDTMNVSVRYSGGTQLSYSLNAHSLFEGWTMVIHGTQGRLEASTWYTGPYVKKDDDIIIIHRGDNTPEVIKVPVSDGEHGGGDVRLQRFLFDSPQPDFPGQMASSRAGALSLLVGVAANKSMASHRSVKIPDLVRWS